MATNSDDAAAVEDEEEAPRAVPPSTTKSRATSWSDLLDGPLGKISARLPLIDYLSFRGVCKNWRLFPSGCSHIAEFSKKHPWMLLYDVGVDGGNTCYLYDRLHPKCCEMSLPHLRGATCMESKAGWLLATRERELFFFNPFSTQVIDLVMYPDRKSSHQLFTFTSPPTSPDCVVFGVHRLGASVVEIGRCSVGDDEWERVLVEDVRPPIETLDGIDHRGQSIASSNRREINHSVDFVSSDLAYSFSFEDYLLRHRHLNPARERPEPTFLDKFVNLHREDWLRRSGQKRISVSFCSLQMMVDDVVGLFPFVREYAADGTTTTDATKSVKAAWLEPRFPSRS
ncbi:hypothetical protein C4D60_Mb08t09350 [Musa balbisiana]|uniref:Uncharacterized protein n=1 Tax=Musa balbisiana TaxID=52838 RepID=A0A4S8K2H0_MUSBA|nr:hypothetical protein C4D60_Mb08t09350 [Musa balbisiana]